MLDYTKAAIAKTVEDFKRLDLIRNVSTQIFYILYLVYTLIAGTGVIIANAILLMLSVSYFVFFVYATKQEVKKTLKKTVKRVFKRCKQLIKLFTLGVMIYGICSAAGHATVLSVLLTVMLVVFWILQIVFEVLFHIIVGRVQFIIDGLEADYKKLTKPVKTVGNFFKKLSGKPVEEEKEPTKNQIILEERVAEAKAERKAKKDEEKRARKNKFFFFFNVKKEKQEDMTKEPENSTQRIPAPDEEQFFRLETTTETAAAETYEKPLSENDPLGDPDDEIVYYGEEKKRKPQPLFDLFRKKK